MAGETGKQILAELTELRKENKQLHQEVKDLRAELKAEREKAGGEEKDDLDDE